MSPHQLVRLSQPAVTRERNLAVAAKAGDARARDELVTALKPLIGNVARMYRRSSIDHLELTQEGVVGVLRALERYDPARGTPFWAYASWWVRQAMQKLVAELTRPVVLSDRAARQLARLKAAQQEHLQRDGAEGTAAELATETGLKRAQVQGLLGAERAPRALDERINRDEASGSTFGELLVDPTAEEAYEGVPGPLEVDRLHVLMRSLTARERGILRARYGLGGPTKTLRELGGELRVSAERVRQIEERALNKLREAAVPAAPPSRRTGTRRSRPRSRARQGPAAPAAGARRKKRVAAARTG
jgi:RNA polymerase sigma factor (sigma-70 family)